MDISLRWLKGKAASCSTDRFPVSHICRLQKQLYALTLICNSLLFFITRPNSSGGVSWMLVNLICHQQSYSISKFPSGMPNASLICTFTNLLETRCLLNCNNLAWENFIVDSDFQIPVQGFHCWQLKRKTFICPVWVKLMQIHRERANRELYCAFLQYFISELVSSWSTKVAL